MTLKEGAGKSATVQSDIRLLDILRGIKELDGAGVTELADHLDLPKSTVHNHLSTLYVEEFVVKKATEYHIGLRFLDFGETARKDRTDSESIEQKVSSLARQTGERCQFMVEEHGNCVYLYKADGENSVTTDSRIGRHIPLHAAAAGKAIMAHLPEAYVTEIIETKGLTSVTEGTITDEQTLRAELERIRESGYATNMEESTAGLRGVGAPVLRPDGTVAGAISISGPTHRFKGEHLEEEMRDLVLGATNEVELNITFS